MKIRWTQDSVRFRITPTELDALAGGSAVSETLALGAAGTAAWSAEILPGAIESRLEMDARGVLRIALSAGDLERLADPGAEGVYFSQAFPPGAQRGGAVKYLIEKDFPCAHPRPPEAEEPASEVFVAPAGFKQRKK